MRAYVTASNSGGGTTAISTPSAAVGSAPPENTKEPQVTGTARVGSMLTADPGTWVDVRSYSYRWWRCVGSTCAYVDGATSPTFLLRATDAGATFRVVVTASNAGGSSTAHSDPTAVVATTVAARPALLAGAAAVSRAARSAGGTFTAKVALRRSDGGRLATARVGCGARIAGRALHVVRHTFANRVATCTWALPAWSGGKRITGTVRVTPPGASSTRRAFGARDRGCLVRRPRRGAARGTPRR